MSKIYDKYSLNDDFVEGMSEIMYDIRASRIRKQDLVELANELVKNGQIPATSQFEKKKWWTWSKKYVNYLMYGMSTGRVSKEYLLFYARVSEAVKIKYTVFKATGAVIIVVIAGLIIKSLNNG